MCKYKGLYSFGNYNTPNIYWYISIPVSNDQLVLHKNHVSITEKQHELKFVLKLFVNSPYSCVHTVELINQDTEKQGHLNA